jgi:hypothetical protein
MENPKASNKRARTRIELSRDTRQMTLETLRVRHSSSPERTEWFSG